MINPHHTPFQQPDRFRDLLLTLQSATDLTELQETVLSSLVYELGYRRAIIGLYQPAQDVLTSWLSMESAQRQNGAATSRMAHTDAVAIRQINGPLQRAFFDNILLQLPAHEPPTTRPELNQRLQITGPYIVLPLTFRGDRVGLILLDQLTHFPLTDAEQTELRDMAVHAGVALGSMRLCIHRAQELAVTEERNRIAVDLHDNVSQVLYGLAYGLQACVQMLPDQPQVQGVLDKLHTTVSETQGQIRQTIFNMRSVEMSADSFVA